MKLYYRLRKGFSVISPTVIIFLASITVNACTCVASYSPWIAHFSNADAVFVGRVRAVIPVKRKRDEVFLGDRIVTFEVSKAYKGIAASTRLISMYSDYGSTSCSFGVDSRKGPRVGEKWIVLAYTTETPQMFFGGSCNASRKIRSKAHLQAIEDEAFKFPQRHGVLGSVVLSYLTLAKDVEVTLKGGEVNMTLKVDAEGYYWFPLDRPGKYSVTGKIPFRTTLINAVLFPEIFEASNFGTTFTYNVDLKDGEYHYNELNVNEPRTP